jgi:osmotically inducible protein OsmC
MQPIHTATVTAKGGRDGFVRSAGGVLDLPLTMPEALGGKGAAAGTNPEELFAAGYAACFEATLRLVARERRIELDDVVVTADVTIGRDGAGFALAATIRARIDGVDRSTAEDLAASANAACPYTKAVAGNLPLEVVVEA